MEVIKGVECITVKEFATLTNRHSSHIYILINNGNKHRRLLSIKYKGRVYIPKSELVDFPFTGKGEKMSDLPKDELLRIKERLDNIESRLGCTR